MRGRRLERSFARLEPVRCRSIELAGRECGLPASSRHALVASDHYDENLWRCQSLRRKVFMILVRYRVDLLNLRRIPTSCG